MNIPTYRCIICDTLTLPGLTFLEDDMCDDCARIIQLDLTIDLNFELEHIGIE